MSCKRLSDCANLLTFIILASATLAFCVGMFLCAYTEGSRMEHPTYHCDASDTMGYPAPGTNEARACWIEENK